MIKSRFRIYFLLGLLSLMPFPSHSFGLPLNTSLKAGIPHPVNLSMSVDILPNLGLGVKGTPLSPTINLSEVSLHHNNFEAFFQYFPYGKPFFVGAFIGKHSIFAKKSQNVDVILLGSQSSIPVTAEGTIRSWYFGPNMGWRFEYDSGFFFSLDLGVLIPFGTTTELEAATTDALGAVFIESVKQTDSYKNLEAQVRDKGNSFGNTTLPCLTLIEFGWRFDL